MNTVIRGRLAGLRALMDRDGIDAFVVPSADPHQSEYVCDHWKCRAWLSGFSGSAGTVAVLRDKAGLWTDGRYFFQAEAELAGSGIDLFKMLMPDVPELIDWLAESVPEGGVVAADGRQLTVADHEKWNEKLGSKSIDLRLDVDLVSELWLDRPPLPSGKAQRLAVEYAGRAVADKLKEIRTRMAEIGAGKYLLSSLDDIAWLFNLRGSDVAHCPVALSYALVSMDSATLFIDEAKIDGETRRSLQDDGVGAAPYESITVALAELAPDTALVFDAKRLNALLLQVIPDECKLISERQLTALPKARKNPVELDNWRRVHELDGVAMVRFLRWLEAEMINGGVTECSAADQLERFRRACPECVDTSFPSISAYGPNAAIAHYAPKPGECLTLEPRGLFLIDSGGQYRGGTTDITRTIALGDLTDEERTDYTLVLKGMIALSSARFPKGAAGNNLDTLARQPLWAHGIDYMHGTGHGVGCYLNVHEGPQNFSQSKRSDTPLEPGMVITIEPGIYRQGRHGIRTENMVVVENDTQTEFGTFYRFRAMTLCPIDTTPLKRELLTPAEIDWLNGYHQAVREKLAPHLDAEDAAWLAAKTRPVGA